MTTEVGKPIPGTRSYEASSEGRIRSPKQVLKQNDNGIGYQIVSIVFADGRKHSAAVHRMVAAAFLGMRRESYRGRAAVMSGQFYFDPTILLEAWRDFKNALSA